VRKSLQWLVSLVVSLAALWLAFRGANLAEVAQALRQANYFYVWPALGLTLVALLSRAKSWHTILGPDIPFRRAFAALNEGYLLNNLLPFRLGELARVYLISRGTPLSVTQAFSSVLVERAVDLIVVVGMFTAFLPLVAGQAWAREAAVVSVVISLTALLSLILLAHNRARVLQFTRWLFNRPFLARFNAKDWEARAEAFIDGLAVLQEIRRSLLAVFWSAFAWTTAGLSAWALLLVFTPSATPTMGIFTFVVLGLGIALPSAPGSAGVFEAAVVGALSVFKVESSVAFTYAVLLHLINFSLTCLIGGIALAREGETLSHLAQAAQSLVTSAKPVEPIEPVEAVGPSIE